MGFVIKEDFLVKYKEEKGVTEVIIPDSVKYLGTECFMNCKNIVSVHLPEGLTHLPYRAFKHCRNLQNINLPDSLETIENSVFAGCWKLSRLNIPEKLTSIGKYAFYECPINFCFELSGHSLPVQLEDTYTDTEVEILKKFLCAKDSETRKELFQKTDSAKYKCAEASYLLRTGQGDEEIQKYVKRNFMKLCKYYMKCNYIPAFQELLQTNLLTKANLEKLITHAIDNSLHEFYVLLLEYKSSQFGFEDIETTVQKKFKL